METLNALGLGDYQPSAGSFDGYEREAMNWLARWAPLAAETVRSETRRIVWLEPRDATAAIPFASTTFFEDLGTTYLTPSALHYIPPRTLFHGRSIYALAENLFHEATHQELYRGMEAGVLLREEARGMEGPEIDIPWRQACWRLEKAFHALVVYLRVRDLRCRAIQDPRCRLENSAVESAECAIDALRSGITPYRSLQLPLARGLIE